MNWISIIGISIGLAMDALAVSVAVGLHIPELTRRHIFRIAFHFGLFQFFMPIIGWFLGRTVSSYIVAFDHWVAFGLLTLVGGRMLWEAFHKDRLQTRSDPTRGWHLVTLSVATSIDAFAVGLSMAFLNVSVWLPSVVIGLVAGTLSMIGIRFGHRIGSRFEHVAEFIGGLVLLGIGLRILLTHENAGTAADLAGTVPLAF